VDDFIGTIHTGQKGETEEEKTVEEDREADIPKVFTSSSATRTGAKR